MAIDIVILPPESIMDLTIGWNRRLCEERPDNIALNKFDTLPHITLAMGCLSEQHVPDVRSLLSKLAGRHSSLHLQVPRIKPVTSGSGNTVVTLDILASALLVHLHEDITRSFGAFLTNDAVEDDLFDRPPIDPSSIQWINRYLQDQSGDKFWPHVTVGFGNLPADFQPFSFTATRLAVCHLGNHCTCRKILMEVELDTADP